MQIPTYDKLLFFSDAAVIPRPTLQQRIEMIGYAIHTCHRFGIAQPRITLIHSIEYTTLKGIVFDVSQRGQEEIGMDGIPLEIVNEQMFVAFHSGLSKAKGMEVLNISMSTPHCQ